MIIDHISVGSWGSKVGTSPPCWDLPTTSGTWDSGLNVNRPLQHNDIKGHVYTSIRQRRKEHAKSSTMLVDSRRRRSRREKKWPKEFTLRLWFTSQRMNNGVAVMWHHFSPPSQLPVGPVWQTTLFSLRNRPSDLGPVSSPKIIMSIERCFGPQVSLDLDPNTNPTP